MDKRHELSPTSEVAAARERLIAFCKQRKVSDVFSTKKLKMKLPIKKVIMGLFGLLF